MDTHDGLFGADVPDGFEYRDDFISEGEEHELTSWLAAVEFSNFEMRGAIARRRVSFFGYTYQSETPAPPIPDVLLPFRARVADWARLEPDAFAMALINEYRSGAPIGWHRDAPQYGIVAGISLLSACRMKFRPYVAPRDLASESKPVRRATHEILLRPRSAYLMTGASRSQYEHHIPNVDGLRYSVTFRTLRSGR
jgi:alkylated DNA repair dioxygenase AlkB